MGGSSREGNAENVFHEAHRDDVVIANDVLLDTHKEDDGANVRREGYVENILLAARRDDVVVAKDVLHGAHQEDDGEEAEMGVKMYSTKRTGPTPRSVQEGCRHSQA